MNNDFLNFFKLIPTKLFSIVLALSCLVGGSTQVNAMLLKKGPKDKVGADLAKAIAKLPVHEHIKIKNTALYQSSIIDWVEEYEKNAAQLKKLITGASNPTLAYTALFMKDFSEHLKRGGFFLEFPKRILQVESPHPLSTWICCITAGYKAAATTLDSYSIIACNEIVTDICAITAAGKGLREGFFFHHAATIALGSFGSALAGSFNLYNSIKFLRHSYHGIRKLHDVYPLYRSIEQRATILGYLNLLENEMNSGAFSIRTPFNYDVQNYFLIPHIRRPIIIEDDQIDS